ncbi:peptidoglycan DD-metalloendopeptidase family protein [candidate division KSB1 bacterium]|nr:peptidoglycan DD-metalloendopeptidase family protein [candidate division KSB1 bacterium]
MLRFIFILLIFPLLVFAQNQQKQLDELRQKIARLQGQIAAQEKNETSTLEFLRALDEQIDLTHRLVGQLQKQERDKRAKIESTEQAQQRTQRELERLKQLAAERAVLFYKYGRLQDVEILLTARSLNQMLLWAKYHQQLTDNDRRILAGIGKKRTEIGEQKSLLAAELQAQQRTLSEKQKEEATLKKRRTQRQDLLKKARKDKSFYQMQLAETQRAIDRIKQLIASAEANTSRRETARANGNSQYDRLVRKSMPWPVDGRVVTHYGTYRHPVLNTVTTNLGIDIAAPAGTPVRSVASGRVTALTWQRGYGNLMIISHADGYYTVYSHLADIGVALNDEIAADQTIGAVGETGSLQGPTLHFQVWQREEALNPEEWLRQ